MSESVGIRNSCRYDTVQACRQRTAKASLGIIDIHGGVSGQQGVVLRGSQSPYKMLYGIEPDLRLLRVIGARAFVRIEKYSETLELKAM